MMRGLHRLTAIAILAFVTGAWSEESLAKSPNVLLICVDDLKPRIGCYGDPLARTPNIDQLAQRGVRFDRAYCNQAVCSPSRNALLVGLRPQTLGIYDLPTHFRDRAPNALTLPQHLKSQGYFTRSFGKVFHAASGNRDDSLSWSAPSFRPSGRAYQLEENIEIARGNTDSRAAAFEGADAPEESYPDAMIAQAAIETIEARKDQSEPWFLAVGFHKPHLPFVSPKKYWDLYDPSKIELASYRKAPEGAPKYAPHNSGELRNYSNIPDQGTISDSLQTELIHGYLAAISFTDNQIGRLLECLDTHKLADNTIVVLWGDHGWHLGDHGMWCKQSNYEQATRIPVIFSVPGLAKNKTANGIIESVDIYPTLCELLGVPTPESLDGKSFASLLRDPSRPHRDHAIQVYPRSKDGVGPVLGRAIRTERYRLVEWKPWKSASSDGNGTAQDDSIDWELYDYQTDPLETKNLVLEQPEVADQLRKLLQTHPDANPPKRNNPQANNQNPSPNPTDRKALFLRKDTDQDGILTYDEFMAGQRDPEQAKERFRKFDRNSDGKLNQEEFVSSGKSG